MWNASDFDKPDFWERLFNEGQGDIEWYTNFSGIDYELQKDLTSRHNNILIPGGGFSTLACCLAEKGYTNIVHSDVSTSCINKMNDKYGYKHSNVKFEVCDILNNHYKDGNFDVVIDKALFDSFYCMNNNDNQTKADNYIKEISRIIKLNGKFIVITLAQPFVAKYLLNLCQKYFTSIDIRVILPKINIMPIVKIPLIKIMPIFYIMMSKKSITTSHCNKLNLYFCNETIDTIDIQLDEITNVQHLQFVHHFCSYTKNIGIVRFSTCAKWMTPVNFIVVDCNLEDTEYIDDYLITFVDELCFNDLIFLLDEGVTAHARKLNAARVCYVFVNAEFYSDTYKQYFDELTFFAMRFRYVTYLPNKKVKIVKTFLPFYTVTINYPEDSIPFYKHYKYKTLDERDKLSKNDCFVVTRYCIDDTKHLERHLIFKSNPLTIQSSVIVDDNNNIQTEKFTSEYHCAVIIILATIGCNDWNIVCIGLGGGQLSMSLSNLLPISSIISVEADKKVVELATNYFGFQNNSSCNVVIGDGVDYINSLNFNSVNCIIYDVNNNNMDEDIVCPSPIFLDENILRRVYSVLTPNGILILNVVTRTETSLNRIVEQIRSIFSFMTSYFMEEEENIILLALKTIPSDNLSISVPKLFGYSKLKHFKNDSLFKTTLNYMLSKK